jgi:tetratricopeptide (TPR) repeat protein
MNRLQQLLGMLEKQQDDPFLIYAAGVEYEAEGQPDQAHIYFDELLSRFPEYLPTYYKYGVMLALEGKDEQAEELFNNGIALAEKQGEMKTLRELRSALENLD